MSPDEKNKLLSPGHALGTYTIDTAISVSNVSITYSASDESSTRVIIKEYYPVNIATRDETGSLAVSNMSNQEFYEKEKASLQIQDM